MVVVDTSVWIEAHRHPSGARAIALGELPAAADRGHRFGLADWLIAALATEIGGLVWSLDQDFAELERLKMCRRFDV